MDHAGEPPPIFLGQQIDEGTADVDGGHPRLGWEKIPSAGNHPLHTTTLHLNPLYLRLEPYFTTPLYKGSLQCLSDGPHPPLRVPHPLGEDLADHGRGK